MAGHLRAWVVWWVLCAALWLMLVDRTPLAELVVGAGMAAIGATGAVLVRARRQVVLRPRARWLAGAWRPVLGTVTDLAPLAGALVRRGVLRREGRGAVIEVPFAEVGEGREEATYRVLTEALGSLAPNTIVVGVDAGRRVLLAHQLVPTLDVVRAACPLRSRAA